MRGFTLIELSIVLVIIGLIAGSILAGRDLIRIAEIRRIIREVGEFKVAVNTFKVKYNAIPGDFSNAEEVWGSDVSCPDTPANFVPKQPTCNGNGNGRVGFAGYETDLSDITAYDEIFRFWQQLSNAGFIGGSYTGTERVEDALDSILPGINVPKTAAFNSAYSIMFLYKTFLTGGGSPLPDGFIGRHYYIVSRPGTSSPYNFGYPALLNDAAYNLDKKMDDGNPAEGQVVSYNIMYPPTGDTDCVTQIYALPSQYNLTKSDVTCSLAIAADF
mgnify:CR=1 FL=1